MDFDFGIEEIEDIHKRFPSFVVKILRLGRPENCRPKTPR